MLDCGTIHHLTGGQQRGDLAKKEYEFRRIPFACFVVRHLLPTNPPLCVLLFRCPQQSLEIRAKVRHILEEIMEVSIFAWHHHTWVLFAASTLMACYLHRRNGFSSGITKPWCFCKTRELLPGSFGSPLLYPRRHSGYLLPCLRY